MAALFDNLSLVQHDDEVYLLNGTESMGNEDLRAREGGEVFLDDLFGDAIEGAGRFIEQEDGWSMG